MSDEESAHTYIDRLEYPVQYRERLHLSEREGDKCLSAKSSEVNGGWDAEVSYKCECGEEFIERERALEHLAEMEDDD